MIDTTDKNGVQIVRELIKIARNGGGFVKYIMPQIDHHRNVMKLSYAAPVPGWDCYIGAGDYIDNIEENIARRQTVLYEEIVIHCFFILVAMSILGVISFLLSRFISEHIRKNINVFSMFFHNAAKSYEPIPNQKIAFQEFISLAQAANDMLEAREITLQKLRESEERYRSIFENTMDGYYRTDLQSRIIMANPAALSIIGYDYDDILGKEITQLHTDPQRRVQFLEKIKSQGYVYGYQASLIHKNGNIIEVATNARVLTDPVTGETIGIEGTLRDITKQYTAQKELETREQYYRSLFENTGAATILYGDDTIIRSCNSRFAELSGYAAKDIIDRKSWKDFAHPDEHERMLRYHAARIDPNAATQAPPDYDFIFLDKEGNIKTVHMHIALIPGTHNRIMSIIDISDRKRVEEDLAQLNRDLEALVLKRTEELQAKAEALEDANVRLREMDEIKSSLLSSVSHELRTPLTSIMGFAKITGKSLARLLAIYSSSGSAPDPERFDREYHRIQNNLEIIAREGERLTRLINDFLDLDRIESGLMPLA